LVDNTTPSLCYLLRQRQWRQNHKSICRGAC
jgi:hypothetical protein